MYSQTLRRARAIVSFGLAVAVLVAVADGGRSRHDARPGPRSGATSHVLGRQSAEAQAAQQEAADQPADAAGPSVPPPAAPATGGERDWRPRGAVPHPARQLAASRTPAAAPAGAATVTIDRAPGEWLSWALLNRRTGAMASGGDSGTNSTESMIKAWIAADYLQGLGGRDPSAADLDLMRRMIRDSDDAAAEQLYTRRGGDAVIRRLIATCGLSETRVHAGWWSLTQVSARDAARMGDCIADGRAADARWTAWLLSEMRQVRGEGRFGIVEVQPAAIKNGWTKWWDGTWHVNCLGVTDGWTLAVLIRYPAALGLAHGADVCRKVTRQLAPPA